LFSFVYLDSTCEISGDETDIDINCCEHQYQPSLSLPSGSVVAIEINTKEKNLYFFVNNVQIQCRIINVPKNVYFGV
jgi:hypothetical protein